MCGPKHVIDHSNVYEDVVDLYRESEVVGEYPLSIKFQDEQAVDQGGVQRDMLSAFWAEAYTRLFEGAKTLTPMMIHPGLDMAVYPILGRIISHGYLACGLLPVCISLPSLINMILGPTVPIPSDIIIQSFADYVSDVERSTLKAVLDSKEPFSLSVRADLINILSRFGCRQVPTRSTFVLCSNKPLDTSFVPSLLLHYRLFIQAFLSIIRVSGKVKVLLTSIGYSMKCQ